MALTTMENSATEIVLSFDDIVHRLPHRFENLILDSIRVITEGESLTGYFDVTISTPDPLGRHLFTQVRANGKPVLIDTIMMEVLALAAIASTGAIPDGYLAIFAAISNFEKKSDFKCNVPMKGVIQKQRGKGGFLRYKGQILDDEGNECAVGDIMAVYMDARDNIPAADEKACEIPTHSMLFQINSERLNRQSGMVFVNELLHLDSETALARYTYPASHPLTRGHFPNNPIMMGVTQWLTVADTCYAIAQYQDQQNSQFGQRQFTGNARIIKEDGTHVADIKAFSVRTVTSLSGADDIEMLSVKKVVFRAMVRPGETLYIHVTDLAIHY